MITARIFAHEKCYPFITPNARESSASLGSFPVFVYLPDMMSPTSFSAMDLLIMP